MGGSNDYTRYTFWLWWCGCKLRKECQNKQTIKIDLLMKKTPQSRTCATSCRTAITVEYTRKAFYWSNVKKTHGPDGFSFNVTSTSVIFKIEKSFKSFKHKHTVPFSTLQSSTCRPKYKYLTNIDMNYRESILYTQPFLLTFLKVKLFSNSSIIFQIF